MTKWKCPVTATGQRGAIIQGLREPFIDEASLSMGYCHIERDMQNLEKKRNKISSI